MRGTARQRWHHGLAFLVVGVLWALTVGVAHAAQRPPSAAFTASRTNGTAPLTVQFSDRSRYKPTSWLWSFGDGSTAQLQNPTHVYLVAGSYTVSLTAANSAGSSTATQPNYITVRATTPDTTPPTAPGNLQATAQSDSAIKLTWQASTDNVGVAGYNVYLDAQKVAQTTVASYLYTGLTCGTTYTLGVAAFDAAGNVSSISPVQLSLTCTTPGAAAAIPVLLYHQVDTGESTSVTSANFDAQLTYLAQQGYHAINAQQYAAWRANPAYPLPSKPILITFDDGQSSASKATPILQKDGFRATMFVVTGFANNIGERFGTYYLSWAALHQMDSAGVWDWAFHAGEHGHDYYSQYKCPYFYTCLFPGETFDQYQSRVTTDIDDGMAELSQQFPTWSQFAVPWSEYGQDVTNDPRILGFLLQTFRSRFQVIFVEDPSDQVYDRLRYRFTVGAATTMSQFIAALTNPAFAH